MHEHLDAESSHGICPECLRDLYPAHADDLPGPGGEESSDSSEGDVR